MTPKKAQGIKDALTHQREYILKKLSDRQHAQEWTQLDRDLVTVEKKIKEIKKYLP